MMLDFLSEISSLSEFQRAVRDEFARGGSARDFLILWFTLITFVILCRMLWRLQQRIVGAVPTNNPRRLFERVLKQLSLSPTDKRLLRSLARNAGAEHPTTLLLSPVLFDRAVEAWRSQQKSAQADLDRRKALLFTLKQNLFSVD